MPASMARSKPRNLDFPVGVVTIAFAVTPEEGRTNDHKPPSRHVT